MCGDNIARIQCECGKEWETDTIASMIIEVFPRVRSMVRITKKKTTHTYRKEVCKSEPQQLIHICMWSMIIICCDNDGNQKQFNYFHAFGSGIDHFLVAKSLWLRAKMLSVQCDNDAATNAIITQVHAAHHWTNQPDAAANYQPENRKTKILAQFSIARKMYSWTNTKYMCGQSKWRRTYIILTSIFHQRQHGQKRTTERQGKLENNQQQQSVRACFLCVWTSNVMRWKIKRYSNGFVRCLYEPFEFYVLINYWFWPITDGGDWMIYKYINSLIDFLDIAIDSRAGFKRNTPLSSFLRT